MSKVKILVVDDLTNFTDYYSEMINEETGKNAADVLKQYYSYKDFLNEPVLADLYILDFAIPSCFSFNDVFEDLVHYMPKSAKKILFTGHSLHSEVLAKMRKYNIEVFMKSGTGLERIDQYIIDACKS